MPQIHQPAAIAGGPSGHAVTTAISPWAEPSAQAAAAATAAVPTQEHGPTQAAPADLLALAGELQRRLDRLEEELEAIRRLQYHENV